MALHISGVDLVVKGFTQFVNSLQRSEVSSRKLDKTLENLQRRNELLTRAWSEASRRRESAWNKEKKAADKLKDAQNRLEAAEMARNALGAETEQNANEIAEAERDIASATRQVNDAFRDYVVSANGYHSASAKVVDILGDLSKAQSELSAANALTADGLAGFAGSLASIVPFGSQISSALAAIGVTSTGVLVPALLAVGAAFVTIKVAAFALNAAINVLKFTFNALVAVVKGIGNIFVSAFKAIGSIIEWATRPLRTFLQHVVEIASGIALWRTLRNIGEAFKNMAEEVFGAVASFQTLEIRLDSLIARDYSRNLGISMADAFERAAGASQTLFEWMRKLAIQTPVGVENIAQVFTLSSAMGLTTEKTKELTEATVNFTSAMGLGDEVMWRIIYNFGQMIQRGKLSGEEFRDLARNFVPIDAIMQSMAERAGSTKEAFRELALEGGVPVIEFLNEFIKISNEDYPGVAEKMTRTWSGITEKIRDFFQAFVGIDVVKPTMDKFTRIVSDAFDKIQSDPKVYSSTKFLGQVLLEAFNYITPAVDGLVASFSHLWDALFKPVQAVNEFANRFGVLSDNIGKTESKVYGWAQTLATIFLTAVELVKRVIDSWTKSIERLAGTSSPMETLVRNAKDWALRFVGYFAKGLTEGVKLITIAVKVIGQILAVWFKPSSPPLIAPDIDRWGAETMNEWIKGFTQADFSIFNDVSDLVESYIRSISDSLAEGSLTTKILEARGGIASMLSGGGAINLFGGIDVSGIGTMTSLFSKYISKLMEAEGAQKILDAVNDEIERARAVVEAAQAAYENFSEEAYGLAAAELAVANAAKEVDKIQEKINDATEKYSAILNDLQSQLTEVTTEYDEEQRLGEIAAAFATQRLTAEEKQRLEMEKRSIEIKRQIRAVEDQRDAEIANLKEQLKQAQSVEEQARARLDAIEAQIEAEKALLQAQIDNAEAVLRAAEERKALAEANLDSIEEQAEMIKSQIQILIEQNNLLKEQNEIMSDIDESASELLSDFSEIENLIPEDFGLDLQKAFADAQLAADGLMATFGEFKDIFEVSGITGAWDDLKASISDIGVTMSGWIGEEGIGKKVEGMWDGIRNALKIPEDETFVDWLGKKVEEWSPKIAFGAALVMVAGSYLLIAAGSIYDAIEKATKNKKLQEFIDFMDNIDRASTNFKAGTKRIADAWKELDPYIPDINIGFGSFGDAIKNFFLSLSPWTTQASLVLDLYDTIKRTFPDIGEILLEFSRQYWKFSGNIADAIRKVRIAIEEWMSALPGITPPAAVILGLIEDVFTSFGFPVGYRASGGRVLPGGGYIVGEQGPELYSPKKPGYIYPNGSMATQSALGSIAASPVFAPQVMGGSGVDKSVHIEINPSYSQTQSEASIYYDVAAALAMAWR